jgi:hypothetical protein
MQKIVYLLGAGFSKPLGLPVMSDFIDMAKDLYSRDTQKYNHFSHVFRFIHDELAWVKTVYSADLNNIEEVLSILEMLYILDQIREKEVIEYKKFLIDVIDYYTPQFNIPKILKKIDHGLYTSEAHLFTRLADIKQIEAMSEVINYMFPSSLLKNYIFFVLGLFNSRLLSQRIEDKVQINCLAIENPFAEYSIITLNYDLVLERIAEFLSSFTLGNEIQFAIANSDNKSPTIIHLHGSVENQNIIPPTWQKTVDNAIEKEWKAAYDKLSSANHIRVIGYSLPITDAYIRYLLKASILKNNELKSINVLCLDQWGEIKKRYDNFIELPAEKYQYSNINVTEYLASAAGRVVRGQLMDDAPKLFTNDWVNPFSNIV